MNTIRRYAAEDAHVIYGTAYDESLGDQLRVTVIATGLSAGKRQQAPMTVVHSAAAAPAQMFARTGTDNIPVLNHAVGAGHHGLGMARAASDFSGLNTPACGVRVVPRPLPRSTHWPAMAWTKSEIPAFCVSRLTDPSGRQPPRVSLSTSASSWPLPVPGGGLWRRFCREGTAPLGRATNSR